MKLEVAEVVEEEAGRSSKEGTKGRFGRFALYVCMHGIIKQKWFWLKTMIKKTQGVCIPQNEGLFFLSSNLIVSKDT